MPAGRDRKGSAVTDAAELERPRIRGASIPAPTVNWRRAMRNQLFMISGLATVALFAAACGSSTSGAGAYGSGPSSPAASASSPAAAGGQGNNAKTVMLKTRMTSLGTIVTTAGGFTLYWYAPDTSTSSRCTGSCASAWPPVDGHPQAAMGVSLPGTLGTITRPGGAVQVTYQGHPLCLYAADTAPGMTCSRARRPAVPCRRRASRAAPAAEATGTDP